MAKSLPQATSTSAWWAKLPPEAIKMTVIVGDGGKNLIDIGTLYPSGDRSNAPPGWVNAWGSRGEFDNTPMGVKAFRYFHDGEDGGPRLDYGDVRDISVLVQKGGESLSPGTPMLIPVRQGPGAPSGYYFAKVSFDKDPVWQAQQGQAAADQASQLADQLAKTVNAYELTINGDGSLFYAISSEDSSGHDSPHPGIPAAGQGVWQGSFGTPASNGFPANLYLLTVSGTTVHPAKDEWAQFSAYANQNPNDPTVQAVLSAFGLSFQ